MQVWHGEHAGDKALMLKSPCDFWHCCFALYLIPVATVFIKAVSSRCICKAPWWSDVLYIVRARGGGVSGQMCCIYWAPQGPLVINSPCICRRNQGPGGHLPEYENWRLFVACGSPMPSPPPPRCTGQSRQTQARVMVVWELKLWSGDSEPVSGQGYSADCHWWWIWLQREWHRPLRWSLCMLVMPPHTGSPPWLHFFHSAHADREDLSIMGSLWPIRASPGHQPDQEPGDWLARGLLEHHVVMSNNKTNSLQII